MSGWIVVGLVLIAAGVLIAAWPARMHSVRAGGTAPVMPVRHGPNRMLGVLVTLAGALAVLVGLVG